MGRGAIRRIRRLPEISGACAAAFSAGCARCAPVYSRCMHRAAPKKGVGSDSGYMRGANRLCCAAVDRPARVRAGSVKGVLPASEATPAIT